MVTVAGDVSWVKAKGERDTLELTRRVSGNFHRSYVIGW